MKPSLGCMARGLVAGLLMLGCGDGEASVDGGRRDGGTVDGSALDAAPLPVDGAAPRDAASDGGAPAPDAALQLPAEYTVPNPFGAVDDPEGTLVVSPILYVASDATISEAEEADALARLDLFTAIAQWQFYDILQTDTFRREPARVYRARETTQAIVEASPDSAHRMAARLLQHDTTDRGSSHRVYVAALARIRPCTGDCVGGARTFNGPPGSGGGFVQLEHTAMLTDAPYPFLSTLVHELGHAFGLTHVDCRGYDQSDNVSIMSYTPAHQSSGFEPSERPGRLNPEELYLLGVHDQAFVDFEYVASVHNPDGLTLAGMETCIFGPMSGVVPGLRHPGYELYFDGALVSGPDAVDYTRAQADANCAENIANQPTVAVTCLYEDQDITPGHDPWGLHIYVDGVLTNGTSGRSLSRYEADAACAAAPTGALCSFWGFIL